MEKIKINRDANEVTVRFNKCFYDKYCIDKAMSDFEEICDFEEIEGGWVLKLKTEKVDLDVLGYEFYNYVLELMRNN